MARWKISTAVLAVSLVVALAVGLVTACPAAVPTGEGVTPPLTEEAAPQLEKSPGGYDVVPLKYDQITVAAVQMNPKPILDPDDPEHVREVTQRNLEHMLKLCDTAQLWPPGKKHLLVFPEFTLAGFDSHWTRDQWLKVAIEVPGPELEAICEKAKELDCYIAFGAYAKDFWGDWPGMFANTSFIAGPTGEIIHWHWKAYCGMGPAPYFEYGLTVQDVLDRFIELYGVEAVWPVAKTEIGNIATYICSEGFAPETARAFAFNGAEILCRIFGSGGPALDSGAFMTLFRADCAASRCWGVMSTSGSGWTMAGKELVGDLQGGGSMIVDPDGNIRNLAVDASEQIVAYTIPIATHRATVYWYRIPQIRTEIYMLALSEHPSKYPPNLYWEYYEQYGEFPKDSVEAVQWFEEHSRW